MSDFKNRLKELRLSRQYTQEQIAQYLGISRSSYAMYEQGRREPGLEIIESFADFFNVDMDYLLGKKDTSTIITDSYASEEIDLIGKFRQLNDQGKTKAMDYITDLTENTKYTQKRGKAQRFG